MSILTELDTFITGLRNDVITKILDSNLPLVGSGLQSASSSALQFLDDLKSKIDSALSGAPSTSQAIADALNAANIAGLTASVDGTGNVVLNLSESTTTDVALPSAALDFGGSAFGLTAQATFDAIIKPSLNVSLSFDPNSGTLALVDSATPEVDVGVGIAVDVSNGSGGPAQATLGLLNVTVADQIPTTTPEINLDFGLNFDSLTNFTPTASGSIDADLKIVTSIIPELPTIGADLVVHWGFDTTGASAPTIQFEHVSIGLGSLLSELVKTIKPVLDFFGSYPIDQIIHTLTDPLPIIGHLPDQLPLLSGPNGLDPIPSPSGDGIINFLDLGAILSQNPDEVASISKFAEALAIIEQLVTLNQQAAGSQMIDLGSFNLLPGNTTSFTNAATDPLQQINGFISSIKNPAIFSQALQAVQDVFKDIDPNPLNSGLQQAGGLTFPLFDDPSKIVNILIPAAGDGQPVKFIEYTMPALSYQAGIHEFFPVIGPIGLSLDGDFAASFQVSIGYDSMGFQTGNFADGVFLSTPPLAPGESLPLALPSGVPDQTHEPVAFVTADIHGGAGVGIGIASADIEGGFSGGVEAFFPNDSVLRLSDIGSGCFFDPVFGQLNADVALRLTVDFGLFSWTHRIVFAETTLADFTAECSGGAATSDPGFALAQPNPDPVNGPDLLLNVGDRAQFRSIGGHVGTDGDEVFTITNAVTTDNILQTSDPIPGVLAVNAFGVTENYGSAANPMQTITAHLGNGNDTLNVAADVTQALNVDGGPGIDRIYGGSGDDIIHGGDGNDTLVGNGGNDQIFGDGGDDLLEGGPGADLLDGGAGFDQVTYEHSTAGVSFTPTTVNGQPGFIGSGGDAQGDTLVNIEYIIGSNFDDFLWGNPNQGSDLEGLAGNDVLIGGKGNDFLLGGPGADFMFGGAGEDGTSYLTSFGGVRIDLLSHTADGGDATGDTLISIEDVQGSQFDDVLLGDNSANTLDGWRGDDIINGRGGADIISGGDGNDTIFGGADGDTLDGGPGIDLLTYQLVGGPVTVDLRHGIGANGDRIGFITYNTDGSTSFTRFVDYSSFENLTGTNSGDSLTGDLNYNIIRGLAGDDIINGDGGNDTLIGGAGADQLNGGDGFDTASYEDSPGGVLVDLVPILFPFTTGEGFFSDAQGDTLTSIENLRGSAHADTLIGDNNDNQIDPGLSTLGSSPVPGAETATGANTPIDSVAGGGGTDTLILDYSLDDFGQGLNGGFSSGLTDTGLFLRMNFDGSAVLDGVTFTQIEALHVIGTYHDDQIFAGQGNDFVASGGGNDLIYAGIGSDVILAQEGDDTVWYGTDVNQELSFSGGLNQDGSNALFYLDGGRGIDHLSISLAGLDTDVMLAGSDPTVEFDGTNLTLPNGSAIVNFEALDNVMTGGGNDYVAQPGYVDNNIQTGDGHDIIAPGLGVDFVDGGEDFQQGVEYTTEFIQTGDGFFTQNTVIDNTALQNNPGDLLVLDYSSYAGSGGVIGSVQKIEDPFVLFDRIEDFTFQLSLDTNQGTYTASAPVDPDFTQVNFTNIERLFVSGTNQDDLLVGTFATLDNLEFFNVLSNATVRGADLLEGLNGNDLLIGNTGSDTLIGGAGDDILIGTDPTLPTFTTFVPATDGQPAHFISGQPNEIADQTEVDTLTGGAGADTFVLGTADGYFYASFFSESLPDSNRAIITDFNPLEGDTIQLNGFASDYFTVESNGETILYHVGVPDSVSDQLIAEIQNFTGFDLNASYVHYVGGPNGDGVEVAAAARIMAEADPPVPAFAPLLQTQQLPNNNAPLDPPSWVTQDNNPTDLLNALFGGSPPAGIVTESVNLVGDGRAFGTFSGDPFGIGSGIVLSTGQVADLAGVNKVDGSNAQPQVVHLTFTAIGNFNGSTIYRADLSNLNLNFNSLTLHDSNSHVGGSGGEASGFDVDAVALSNKLLASVDNTTNLNDSSVLPELNVFDFSAAGMVFTPGTQRPASGPAFPNTQDMFGSVNGLVDNSIASLGQFDVTTAFDRGWLSLGDGGSLGFNLKQPVSSNGPLYLYVAEAGNNGETLSGDIAASTDRLNAPADLSTDFGAPGPSGDDISFTYHFTTAAGSDVNEIAFQFALFSEELPEFAGTDFNDSFKILLNGVNLAHLSDGAAATVNNLLASPHVPLSSDLVLNPVGTGPAANETRADAYTKLLSYVGAINPGQDNTLTIEVTDVRDGLMDSGILVKAGTFVSGTTQGGVSANGGAISTGSPPDIFEGSPPIGIPIVIDPGALGHLTAPVTIDFTADSHLDLGNGVGVPFEKTFNPGDPLTFNLQVSSPDDHILEGPRFDAIDLAVHSTDPTFNNLAVAPIVVQIDDPQSMLSISDVTHAEGNVGFTAFDFTVTRTGGTAPLTVDFSTTDGTATAASGDYNPTSGTLSFAANETTKTIEVLVNGDISKENDETFSVNLTNPNGAIISDGQGVGTILNDDAANGDTSNTPANTTVVLGATGGTVVNTTNGKVALTGIVNNFITGAGNDSIAGNNNGDILNGGPGNDTIRGGSGADFLIGGPGNDRLTGGLGDDTFIFRPGFGTDTITDFTAGDSNHHDTLDLRGLGFTSVADVLNNHTDPGINAVIHSGADSITLTNVSSTLLQSHQFDILV